MNIRAQVLKVKRKIYANEIAMKILKNSGWLLSDKVFTMLIGVFVTAVVARYFGPSSFGYFNYALAFVSLFTALSTLGLDTLTIKSIVDKQYSEGTILCTSLLLRVIGGILLTTVAALIIRVIEPNDKYLHLLVLIMSFSMVLRSFEVIEYWIQAHQKAKISSIIRMSVYVVTAALKIALVIFSGNLIHFALIYFIDIALIGTALMIAYFKIRSEQIRWNFSINYAKSILSKSWYLILSGLLVTLYMRIDQVMLGSMLSDQKEVGIYSAAIKIAEMWYFIPLSIITSFMPVIMRKKSNNDPGYINTVQLLFTIVLWIGIVFGIIIFIFSKYIVSILYGADYIKAAGVLTVSVWAGVFATLGSTRSTWLICEGLQRYSMIYTVCGAITNIILNYLLIPLMGGYGAALATLITQIIVVLIVPFFFKETRISSIMILKAFKLEGVLVNKFYKK